MLNDLAYLTADEPGIGGAIKQRPEDFLVEEQPLYEPAGSGEHLYLFIEKRGQTTMDVVQQLARRLHVRRSDVGYAGLKDKHAITRQHFSVYLPGRRDDAALRQSLECADFAVLWADRHGNKLRRGHLAGNRFVIHIRDVQPTAALPAKRILDRLSVTGVPNYFGPQRFGHRQNNHVVGRLLLKGQYKPLLDVVLGEGADDEPQDLQAARAAYNRGDYAAAMDLWPRYLRSDMQSLDVLRQGRGEEAAVMSIAPQQREFFVTAMQSHLFNQVLNRRIGEGEFGRLVEGDLASKQDSRGIFAVDAALAELENSPDGRAATMAVSATGPLWGVDMPRAAGLPGQWELDALRAFDLTEADLAGGRQGRAVGTRRPVRVALGDVEVSGGVDDRGGYVRLAFELGRGSFATVVLREVMKSPAADADAEEARGGEP